MAMAVLHTYYVSLGSNYNADFYIPVAVSLISKCFPGAEFSRAMKTEGIGLSYQCWYVNQMVCFQSPLSSEQVRFAMKSLEKQVGRSFRPRIVELDLDVVEVDGVIVHKDYNKYPFLAQLRNDLL